MRTDRPTSRVPAVAPGIAAALLAMAPASALACPVCALVGPGNNTWAYQAMSLMLTVLPLGMVGVAVWYAARAISRADRAPVLVNDDTVDAPSLGAPTSQIGRAHV